MKKSKIPIFVLGTQRSGTTWLANLLCRHDSIVAIQAERHEGVHESVFFSHVKNEYGNIGHDDNFIQLVESFGASDYFIISKLDKEIFYKRRPKDYGEFFRLMMDKYAEKKGADYWLEKSPHHSLYVKEISSYYPDAKFIGIKRNIMDVIRSSLRKWYYNESMEEKLDIPKKMFLLFLIYHYIETYKHLKAFEKTSNSFYMVNFENLKSSKESVTKNLCHFLGINYESKMMKKKYKPNTSFKNKKEREKILNSNDRRIIRAAFSIMRIAPHSIYSVFKKPKEKLTKKYLYGRSEFPDWFYSIKKEKIKDQK